MPPQHVKTMTYTIFDIFLVAKYIVAAIIAVVIFMAPAWLARQTKKGKQDMILVRLGSWIFGWSGIGWLWALFFAVRK